MNRVLNLLSAGGLALLTASSSHAGIFATDLQGGWGDSGRTATIGTPFAVGSSAVSITSLGFFDQTGVGLSTEHYVGIYSTDSSHTSLGSVLVPSGNAAEAYHDGTRWRTLSTPIALAANTEYMLAFTTTATGDQANIASSSQVTIASPLALSGGGYTFTLGSSLAYPTVDLHYGLYAFGANMEVTAIPEPSPLAATVMVLQVVVGCDFCRRYRLNRAE